MCQIYSSRRAAPKITTTTTALTTNTTKSLAQIERKDSKAERTEGHTIYSNKNSKNHHHMKLKLLFALWLGKQIELPEEVCRKKAKAT